MLRIVKAVKLPTGRLPGAPAHWDHDMRALPFTPEWREVKRVNAMDNHLSLALPSKVQHGGRSRAVQGGRKPSLRRPCGRRAAHCRDVARTRARARRREASLCAFVPSTACLQRSALAMQAATAVALFAVLHEGCPHPPWRARSQPGKRYHLRGHSRQSGACRPGRRLHRATSRGGRTRRAPVHMGRQRPPKG